jgi:copper chaperone CopZ
MNKVVKNVPGMWADHHVLNVRDALFELEGIEELYASSAWKQVLVTYDPGQLDEAAIESKLAEAGYPVDGEGPPILVEPTEIRRDPQWHVLGFRTTETNRADVEMSGEFRRY